VLGTHRAIPLYPVPLPLLFGELVESRGDLRLLPLGVAAQLEGPVGVDVMDGAALCWLDPGREVMVGAHQFHALETVDNCVNIDNP
jgi:hypothetical protein